MTSHDSRGNIGDKCIEVLALVRFLLLSLIEHPRGGDLQTIGESLPCGLGDREVYEQGTGICLVTSVLCKKHIIWQDGKHASLNPSLFLYSQSHKSHRGGSTHELI